MKIKYVLILSTLLVYTACRQDPGQDNSERTETLPPIMGWASWNNYHVNINEDIIKSQADAMVELGLTNYGYQYINTDDGFFGGRDEMGRIISHPDRFPSGMKHLAEYIQAKGLRAGIYSDAGINTCASHYDKDTIGVGMGLFGHDREDLTQYLMEWNYDFIKIDWCGANWLNLDDEMRYTQIASIARSIKPEVVLNVCRWQFPGKWVTGMAHSWRIAGDLRANFASVLRTIDANADLWKYASQGHYNDMDMLQVGRGMSYEEDKAHFSMWCLMHSPLLLGNDLTQMSEETLSIITNKDLIDINQSPYVYQARLVIDHDSIQVWGKPLKSTMSGQYAVALLNRTEKPQDYTFCVKEIGLNPLLGYTQKDLWTKEEYPYSTESKISHELPPHGIVVLHLKGTSAPNNFFQSSN